MKCFSKYIALTLLLVICTGCVFAVSDQEAEKIKQAVPTKATMKPAKARTVLVFSLCKGFKHSSIPFWDIALKEMGDRTGAYKATVTYEMDMLKRENLHKFDALVLNNTTRLNIEDADIRKSIMDFIKGGKGILGIHAATDNFYNWPEMQEIMGGKFTGHPWGSGSTVAVKLDDPDNPLLKAFKGKGFNVKDEIYLTEAPLFSREKARVLMSLDMSDAKTSGVDGGKHKNADVGITWVKSVGKGRLFYGSLGHNNDLTWWTPLLQHYLDGLQFVLGDYPVDTKPVSLKTAQDMEPLKTILGQIAKYDYGQSREPLTQLSDFIRGIEGADNLKAVEKELLVFLQSQATAASKQFVCRNLSIIGSQDSAEVLAGMLTEAETSDMARYALERIPGEGIDEILRQTLPKTKGVEKIGVISTLGLRGDKKSVPVLAGLIGDPDVEVASAAVTALGQISSTEARAALAKAKDTTSGDLQMLVLDSYLNCADELIDQGDEEGALEIYRELYTSDIPKVIRSAALRGTVYSIPEKAGEIIIEVIEGGDPEMQAVAFGLVSEVEGDDDVKAIAGRLGKLAPAGQVQLITALANLGSTVAKPAIVSAVTSDNAEVRIAALKGLASLGDDTTVLLLAEAAAKAVGAEKVAARESLYSMRDGKVDAKILASIPEADGDVKVELIRSISQRNIKGALDTLLATATDSSSRVQLESYKVLKTVAGPESMARLIGLTAGIKNGTVRTEAERTIAAIAVEIEDDNDKTKLVLSALKSAESSTIKASLLNILGRIGADNSLDAMYAALNDSDVKVKESAIKAFAEWPNSKPADALLKVAQGASDPRQKILSLRGYVKLASLDAKTDAAKTIERFSKAMSLASGVTEKRMVLAGIATVKQAAALKPAVEYIEDASLAQEAQAAVVTIAAGTYEESPQETKDALQKVLAAAKNEMIRSQAQEVLDKIK